MSEPDRAEQRRRFISGVVEGTNPAGAQLFSPNTLITSHVFWFDLLYAGFYGRPWTMEQRTELFKRCVDFVQEHLICLFYYFTFFTLKLY